MQRKSSALLLLGVAAGVLSLQAMAQETMNWKMLGQPLATGNIQSQVEQPFFENFAERTGLPINVDYQPVDTTGIKDTEQLRIMKAGLFDLVSLRMAPNSRDAPSLTGLDLVGLNPGYEMARSVVDAYEPVLDEQLQERFNIKLLSVWPFGPQIIFCDAPISSLADLEGLKVRVYDQSLAQFVQSIGATPVPLSFPEVHQSLSLGAIDCAITGPSSANSAGWPEVTTHQLTLGMGTALNGYAISLTAWNQLDEEQQATLEASIDELSEEIWTYSEELYNDALNCNSGESSCSTGTAYDLVSVEPSEEDLALVREALINISLPTWSQICDQSSESCSADWKTAVGPLIGLEQ